MIKINFVITNPRRKENFKSLWDFTKSITNHKHLELQFYRYQWYLLELDVDLSWNGSDHAGPEFHLGLFSYHFRIKLYDSRHWDHHNNTWIKYEDKE